MGSRSVTCDPTQVNVLQSAVTSARQVDTQFTPQNGRLSLSVIPGGP